MVERIATAAPTTRAGRRRVARGPSAQGGASQATTAASRRRVGAPGPRLRDAWGCGHWRRPRPRNYIALHRRSRQPLRSLPVGAGGGDAAAVGHTRLRGWWW